MQDHRRYGFEALPNGLVLVQDRRSKSVGAWTRDGKALHGDLTRSTAAGLIGRAIAIAYGRAPVDPDDPTVRFGHPGL